MHDYILHNDNDNEKIHNDKIEQNYNKDNNVQDNVVTIQKEADLEFVYEDNVYFKHLAFVNQTYFEHFKDAIKYSFISLKASFLFFCHAFWPDIFIKTGSDTVHELSKNISEKYQKRIREIIERMSHEV